MPDPLEAAYQREQARLYRRPRILLFSLLALFFGGAPYYGHSIFFDATHDVTAFEWPLVISGLMLAAVAMMIYVNPDCRLSRWLQTTASVALCIGIEVLVYLGDRGAILYSPGVASTIFGSIIIFTGFFNRWIMVSCLIWFGTCAAITLTLDSSPLIGLRLFGVGLSATTYLLAAFMVDRNARVAWVNRRHAQLTSTVDPLTGLGTRAEFNQRYQKQFQQALRDDKPVGVMLLDLDFFKRINDRYGHLAGDRVLEAVGRLIVDRFARRPGDLRIRYGGEEILLLWYDASADAVNEEALRLLDEIRQLRVLLEINSEPLQVTASAGLICGKAGAMADSTAVLHRADELLYEAKRRGRDQLVAEHRA
ncbi:diguanylate cyclase (GGDEF) domain-containing protein [Hydrocarboniphaga daqingensis]|uniref:diguanylate cyclase n=1 Tax=Hydrocarboniphaga daqingensis TaxID=490188 RepID=A0A1M5KMJ2_9GAMM|nr:GGDEF domain-containing protein [Hydrocarboniphaga daqingensis]SHG53936.1 diguanylate cyclase (GGDEF) domain-containing protein [Hydrocarboniphaga daqingensis]